MWEWIQEYHFVSTVHHDSLYSTSLGCVSDSKFLLKVEKRDFKSTALFSSDALLFASSLLTFLTWSSLVSWFLRLETDFVMIKCILIYIYSISAAIFSVVAKYDSSVFSDHSVFLLLVSCYRGISSFAAFATHFLVWLH